MGKHENPRPWQKAFVSLMGPLPGIILGLALGWWELSAGIENELLAQLVLILLIVNFLNLLPIMPLDGGQLLNAVLFSHHPRWQFGFQVLSLLLLLAWMALDRNPVLMIVAFALAAQLPAQYRHMKHTLALLQEQDAESGHAVRRAFRVMERKPNKPQPFMPRFQDAKALVERLQQIKPSAIEAFGCTAIYLMVLLSPLGAAGYFVLQAFDFYEVETDWDAEIAAVTDLPTILGLHVDAAEDYFRTLDSEIGFDYLEAAKTKAESARYEGEEYRLVLDTMVDFAWTAARGEEAVYQDLLAVRTRLDGPESVPVATIHLALAEYYYWTEEDAASALPRARESLAIRRLLDDSWETYLSYTFLAELQEARGELAEAEALYRDAVVLIRQAPDAAENAYAMPVLAEFYVRQDRPERALEELENIANLPLEAGDLTLNQRRMAAVQMMLGQGAAARSLLNEIYDAETTLYGGAGEDEAGQDLDMYNFYVPGSPQRYALDLSVSYWAEGDSRRARNELKRAEQDLGEGFTNLVAEYAEELRSWGEDGEGGSIELAEQELLIAMAEDLRLITGP